MEIAGINNAICLLISVIIAVIVYFVFVIKLGVITKKEMKDIPKGRLLLRISRKFHLIK